jgi:ribosomal protein S18 acetylase RimI-like enzyme
MQMRIEEANLDDPDDASAVVEIIDSYARGPGGQNAPLADHAQCNLVKGLAEHPMATVFLAFVDDRAVGVAVCVWSFSTFAGKPSVNVHDLAVLPGFQNQGIGRSLLDKVEQEARDRGCCKVTLEVHDSNSGAKRLYRNSGFESWDPVTLFVSKPLS